jgi:hypothetical protein
MTEFRRRLGQETTARKMEGVARPAAVTYPKAALER